MRIYWTAFPVVFCATLCAGCGESGSSNTLTQWLGTARHVRVVGTLHGEQIDINVAAPDAATTSNTWCEREYQVPMANGTSDYANGHNSEVRIKTNVTINGEMRIMDLGLKRHNVEADAAGTTVTVIPRDDANSPCMLASCTQSNMWLSWTWRKPADNSVIFKQAAQSGQFKLGEFVGDKDSTGLFVAENSGNVGGFATGQWSATESLTISFDANCTKNNVDNSY
jgi:hypothetical protein